MLHEIVIFSDGGWIAPLILLLHFQPKKEVWFDHCHFWIHLSISWSNYETFQVFTFCSLWLLFNIEVLFKSRWNMWIIMKETTWFLCLILAWNIATGWSWCSNLWARWPGAQLSTCRTWWQWTSPCIDNPEWYLSLPGHCYVLGNWVWDLLINVVIHHDHCIQHPHAPWRLLFGPLSTGLLHYCSFWHHWGRRWRIWNL